MIVVLVEQDAELGQLRQDVEQLREEKTKESGRADKLVEELKGEYLCLCLMDPCNACRLPSEGHGIV